MIQADIDYIISISNNEAEFLQNMEKIGYHVRKGNSQKHGIYFAFRAAEQKRAWRSYKLGEGYSYADILTRLEKEEYIQHHPRSPKLCSYKIPKAAFGGLTVEFQKKRIRKWYFVTFRYHNVKNPYAVDYREVRKTLLQIDQLYENILYLNQYNIRSYEELLVREAKVIEMERKLPATGLKEGDAAKQIKENLQHIRQEKKIIKRIKREEESHPFFYKPTGQANVQIQEDKKKEVEEKWQTTKSI